MSDTRSDVRKGMSKTRIAKVCSVETGVAERVAYGVLWKNWPVTTTAREKVWRWACVKRLFNVRDLERRPPRVRKKTPSQVLSDVVKDFEATIEGPPKDAERIKVEGWERARLESRAAASAEFDRIMAEHAAREGLDKP